MEYWTSTQSMRILTARWPGLALGLSGFLLVELRVPIPPPSSSSLIQPMWISRPPIGVGREKNAVYVCLCCRQILRTAGASKEIGWLRDKLEKRLIWHLERYCLCFSLNSAFQPRLWPKSFTIKRTINKACCKPNNNVTTSLPPWVLGAIL